MTINEIIKKAYKTAEAKEAYNCIDCYGAGKYSGMKCGPCEGSGQTPETAIIQKLKEEVIELQEAFDAKHKSYIEVFMREYYESEQYNEIFEGCIKNSEGDELADLVIVCMAAAGKLGIDLEKHIEAKLKYNEGRE